jgi:hypothetical protein
MLLVPGVRQDEVNLVGVAVFCLSAQLSKLPIT